MTTSHAPDSVLFTGPVTVDLMNKYYVLIALFINSSFQLPDNYEDIEANRG